MWLCVQETNNDINVLLFLSVWDLTRKHSAPGNVLKLEYVVLTNFLFKIFKVRVHDKCHIYF